MTKMLENAEALANPCGAPCYTVLDLFSGIGGFSLGLERTGGFRTIAFCEIEPFPRKVLKKHWPGVPVFEDVRELHAADLPERPDVITGGFPCQPFSKSGKRRGQEDDRHLWPEMFRLVRELKPAWVFGENVVDLIEMGLDEVLDDLESAGYTSRPFVVPAGALQRDHIRERVWIIAYDERQRTELEKHTDSGQIREVPAEPQRAVVSCGNRQGGAEGLQPGGVLFDGETFYMDGQIEPVFMGSAHGIPERLDRRKSLGNTVDPAVVEAIGQAILAV